MPDTMPVNANKFLDTDYSHWVFDAGPGRADPLDPQWDESSEAVTFAEWADTFAEDAHYHQHKGKGVGGGQPPPGEPGMLPPGTPPPEGDEDDNGVPDDLEASAGIAPSAGPKPKPTTEPTQDEEEKAPDEDDPIWRFASTDADFDFPSRRTDEPGVARHAEWDEGAHPRGQPGNPGEFGPGGGVAKISAPALKPLTAPGGKPAGGRASAAQPGAKKASGKPKPVQSPHVFDAKTSRGSESYPPDDELPPQFAASVAHLTPEQTAAVKDYTQHGFRDMNRALRDGTPAPDAESLASLHSAFATAPAFADPVTAWRGLNLEGAEKDALLASLATAAASGEPVKLKGFTSTTLDPAVLNKFSGFDSGRGVTLEIIAKKGMYISSLAPSRERELLLDHASTFRVIGIKQVPFGAKKRQVVQMEQVLDEPPHAAHAGADTFAEDAHYHQHKGKGVGGGQFTSGGGGGGNGGDGGESGTGKEISSYEKMQHLDMTGRADSDTKAILAAYQPVKKLGAASSRAEAARALAGYEAAWTDYHDENRRHLQEAGGTGAELASFDQEYARAQTAVTEATNAYLDALDAGASLRVAEPDYPPEPEEPEPDSEPDEPEEPDDPDYIDPDDPDFASATAAYKAWKKEHAAWKPKHRQWQREYKQWEKAHTSWEKAVDRIDTAHPKVIAAADVRSAKLLNDLDTVIDDTYGTDMEVAAEAATEVIRQRLFGDDDDDGDGDAADDFAEDAHQHQHKGKGVGGGQFTSGSGGGEGGGGGDGGEDVASGAAHRSTAAAWLAKSDLPGDVKERYAATATAVLSKMPAGCRKAVLEALDEHGARTVFYAGVDAVTEALEKETGKKEKAKVGGWVRQPKGGSAVHVHLDGDAGTGDDNTAHGIYAHELGHVVDAERKYSTDPGWQAAWKREIKGAMAGRGLSRYAATSATEGFAEYHRALVQKGTEAAAIAFPKCAAFFRAKGLI